MSGDSPSRIMSGTGSEEISAKDFGYAENEMAVRDGFEYFFTQVFPKFHYPFLMT